MGAESPTVCSLWAGGPGERVAWCSLSLRPEKQGSWWQESKLKGPRLRGPVVKFCFESKTQGQEKADVSTQAERARWPLLCLFVLLTRLADWTTSTHIGKGGGFYLGPIFLYGFEFTFLVIWVNLWAPNQPSAGSCPQTCLFGLYIAINSPFWC